MVLCQLSFGGNEPTKQIDFYFFFGILVINQELQQPNKWDNDETEVKEENVDHKPLTLDNRVSTITTVIKTESRDTAAPKNAVSVVMAPGAILTKQEVKKEDEAERAAVRSNQQANIPLKKRDLKLTESYQSNHVNMNSSSSIIVCNPSVIQSKDCLGRDGNLTNSVAPLSGQILSQPLQPMVTASRQELTNGRAPVVLPHKEGDNRVTGVIGQVGVIGHVGVIRSPSERHRVDGVNQQEPNGPSLDSTRVVEEEREVSRQSVLVRKGPTEGDTAAATALTPQTAMEAKMTSSKCEVASEAAENKADISGIVSLSTEEPGRERAEDLTKKTTEEQFIIGMSKECSSHQQEADHLKDESTKVLDAEDGSNNDQERNKSTLVMVKVESADTIPPLKLHQHIEKEHLHRQRDGVNGLLEAQVRVRDIGLGSEEKRVPLEEASSELQKEGIRLKIKIPPHRRNKLRGKGEREEQKDRVRERLDSMRPLRRSARICRYMWNN